MKTVDEISRLYGCEIEMDGEKYYAFPLPSSFRTQLWKNWNKPEQDSDANT